MVESIVNYGIKIINKRLAVILSRYYSNIFLREMGKTANKSVPTVDFRAEIRNQHYPNNVHVLPP